MLIKDILERQNNNLTFIRIILAFLVIYSHAYPITKSNNAEPFVKYFGFSGGGIAVYIFFFLAGLLVTKSYVVRNNFLSYLTARIFRIFPALIVATLILAIFIGPLLTADDIRGYFNNPETWAFIKNNITLNIQFSLPGVFTDNLYKSAINGSWWTIPVEFKYYMVLMFLGMIGLFKYKYISSLAFILIIILIFLETTPVFRYFLDNKSYSNPAILFAMGCLASIWADYIKINISSVIGLAGLAYLFKGHEIYNLLFFAFLCSAALWVSTAKILIKFNKIPDISYAVYIWGFFAQQLFSYAGINRIIPNTIASVFLCSILGYFSYKYIERPSINLGAKLSKRFF